MRETGLLVANLGVSEMSQVWKYFFHYTTDKYSQSINELKADYK